jgi:NAD(P) transhydrogenase subunit alpha
LFEPHNATERLEALAKIGGLAIAMERIPRITRAQNMDVLSSQANLAGYRAVIDGMYHSAKLMPMMMTAAGTIAPAKVFVMGAGVAGLQAVATARRMGAVVSATDVRAASREQVQSLGASFIMVEDDETKAAETAGGYAKEMSESYKAKQAALIAEHIAKQDIVITTALIPGRPAPVLVTPEMVRTMKKGSVIVDLAVAQGGNCPLSRSNEVIVIDGVTLVGAGNLPSACAPEASKLYARNLYEFIAGLVTITKDQITLKSDDEIVKAALVSPAPHKMPANTSDAVTSATDTTKGKPRKTKAQA